MKKKKKKKKKKEKKKKRSISLDRLYLAEKRACAVGISNQPSLTTGTIDKLKPTRALYDVMHCFSDASFHGGRRNIEGLTKDKKVVGTRNFNIY
jgi:hypothetical protein